MQDNLAAAQDIVARDPDAVYAVDDAGRSALHFAAKMAHQACSRWLIEDCGIAAGTTDRRGRTALHMCASNTISCEESLELGKWLVDTCTGLDVHALDMDSASALHAAAEAGHMSMVQWLVEEKGLRADAKDGTGWTPMHNAARGGTLR
jgi:ankyrin repeat protein